MIAGWHGDRTVDGFHLTPVEPRRDLERLANGTVALLQHRGLFRTFYPGSTLREHLGLARPANRYAVTGSVMTVRRPSRRQIHLAAHFPGVNSTTVWADPRSRSQIAFSSFEQLARTAERGLFDFFFLAEGLRLREHKGRIHDLDVVGRPESLTVLNALAAVTERIGLAATVNATFNEPYELARRLATLDHLSGGRAAWNVVTSSDAFTGENFRRGDTSTARTGTRGRPNSSTWHGSCGTPGPPTACPARSPTGASTSTSRASSPCRAHRRDTRSSSRPGTRRRAGSSRPGPPT